MNNLIRQILEGKKAKEILKPKFDKDSKPEKPKKHTISFEVSNQGLEEISPLLIALSAMGSAGSSRGFEIEDYGKFWWDGDGNSRLDNILVDGEPLQQKQNSSNDETKSKKSSGAAPRGARPIDADSVRDATNAELFGDDTRSDEPELTI